MTMTHKKHRRLGSATLEMTLVGIPLLFVLISIIEVSRGMWIYHTLSYAVREGTRYTIVHGANCKATPNNCPVTVGQIATVIQNAAVGLFDSNNFMVEMKSSSDTYGTLDGNGIPTMTLASALSNTNQFPSAPGDSIGQPITFTVTYPFQSAIAMFWPGAGSGLNFATVTFPASSQELVQF